MPSNVAGRSRIDVAAFRHARRPRRQGSFAGGGHSPSASDRLRARRPSSFISASRKRRCVGSRSASFTGSSARLARPPCLDARRVDLSGNALLLFEQLARRSRRTTGAAARLDGADEVDSRVQNGHAPAPRTRRSPPKRQTADLQGPLLRRRHMRARASVTQSPLLDGRRRQRRPPSSTRSSFRRAPKLAFGSIAERQRVNDAFTVSSLLRERRRDRISTSASRAEQERRRAPPCASLSAGRPVTTSLPGPYRLIAFAKEAGDRSEGGRDTRAGSARDRRASRCRREEAQDVRAAFAFGDATISSRCGTASDGGVERAPGQIVLLRLKERLALAPLSVPGEEPRRNSGHPGFPVGVRRLPRTVPRRSLERFSEPTRRRQKLPAIVVA